MQRQVRFLIYRKYFLKIRYYKVQLKNSFFLEKIQRNFNQAMF